jgi:hypothetical protein
MINELVSLLVVSMLSEGRLICHHDSYVMRQGFCYRYVDSSATYSQATERCVRDEYGTGMLYINSVDENSYIWTDMFSGHNKDEFWLGMDDQANEGDFRWSYNKSKPAYNNFTSNNGDINNDNYDCVKFTDNGWQVAEDFCENLYMPFVCKAPVCESSDGVICDDVRVTESGGGGLSTGAIVAIVIVLLILVCIIVVVVVLGLLWKFKNDTFRHYVCPCVVGGDSKQALMSLQQENLRLRQELNQSKINTSSRFTPGHFGRESVSGVPDGMGGMLPPLKSGLGVPRSPEPFSSPTSPPPLTFQRSTSRVTPVTTPSGGPLFPPTPSVFTGGSQRTFRPSVSGGAQRGVVPLAALNERENEDSSTASEDDDASVERVVLPTDGAKAPTKTAASVEVKADRDSTVKGEAGKDEEVKGETGTEATTEVKGEEEKSQVQSHAESKGQAEETTEP